MRRRQKPSNQQISGQGTTSHAKRLFPRGLDTQTSPEQERYFGPTSGFPKSHYRLPPHLRRSPHFEEAIERDLNLAKIKKFIDHNFFLWGSIHLLSDSGTIFGVLVAKARGIDLNRRSPSSKSPHLLMLEEARRIDRSRTYETTADHRYHVAVPLRQKKWNTKHHQDTERGCYASRK